jgi:MFS superfamily sulfate permease-like transporter
MQTLNHLPEGSRVIIDGTHTINIDQDVLEIIDDFRKSSEYKNITLEIRGLEKKKPIGNSKNFNHVISGNAKEEPANLN